MKSENDKLSIHAKPFDKSKIVLGERSFTQTSCNYMIPFI